MVEVMAVTAPFGCLGSDHNPYGMEYGMEVSVGSRRRLRPSPEECPLQASPEGEVLQTRSFTETVVKSTPSRGNIAEGTTAKMITRRETNLEGGTRTEPSASPGESRRSPMPVSVLGAGPRRGVQGVAPGSPPPSSPSSGSPLSSGSGRLSLRERRMRANLKLCVGGSTQDDSCSPAKVASMTNQIEERYIVVKTLGTGTTSTVQHAIRRSDGKPVALKTMRSRDHELLLTAQHEFDILHRLDHKNIIKPLDFHVFDGRAVIVLEYCEGPTLQEFVKEATAGRLDEEMTQKLAKELFSAVKYLHRHGTVHRDIKPENILVKVVDGSPVLKLVDFNTTCELKDGASLTPTGTQLYAAPEVLLGESPSEPHDVWSAGICVYYMLAGRLPQRRDRCAQSLKQLQDACTRTVSFSGQRWENVSEACIETLQRSLAVDAEERPTIEDLFTESRWLREPEEKDTPSIEDNLSDNMWLKVLPASLPFDLSTFAGEEMGDTAVMMVACGWRAKEAMMPISTQVGKSATVADMVFQRLCPFGKFDSTDETGMM